MNDNLNDAFETYFPHYDPLRKFIYKAISALVLVTYRLRKWIFRGRVLVNERIVEYPHVFQWIKPVGIVLDIGCCSSRLPIQLASLGYEVHGIDVRPYPFTHSNFTFHKTDVFTWSPDQKFDIILLISVLEHFGSGDYGDLEVLDADRQAVEKFSGWLSKNGQLIVTVPFGQAGLTKKHRIYDLKRLKYLFSKFNWVNHKYFQRIKENWVEKDAQDMENITSLELPPNGVALLNLKKL